MRKCIEEFLNCLKSYRIIIRKWRLLSSFSEVGNLAALYRLTLGVSADVYPFNRRKVFGAKTSFDYSEGCSGLSRRECATDIALLLEAHDFEILFSET